MNSENDSSTILSYSPRKNFLIPLIILVITGFVILFFPLWYRFCLNLVILGYYGFKEMRLGTVFFAVVLRIILYPLGRLKKRFDKRIKKAKEEFKEKIKPISHPLQKDKYKRKWLASHQWVVCFDWFYFCFWSMNAFAVGWLFLQPFTLDRLEKELFFSFLLPQFPLNTTSFIPIAGMVDLTKVNMTLNLMSAIGAGLVGLVEVIINKKQGKKELLMYLILFPLGAYFITIWVPSGFEFSLAIFEILTILIILIEKIFESKVFKFFFVREKKELH